MTIHAIRGYVAPDSGMTDTEIKKVVNDWVSARQKWPFDWDATVRRQNTAIDGTGMDYVQFSIRFEWSEDKDNTLQKCADKFKQKSDWFRLVYHVCNHDADNPDGCNWDERWNWEAKNVTVPTEIEAVVPDAKTVVNA